MHMRVLLPSLRCLTTSACTLAHTKNLEPMNPTAYDFSTSPQAVRACFGDPKEAFLPVLIAQQFERQAHEDPNDPLNDVGGWKLADARTTTIAFHDDSNGPRQ